MSNKVKTRVCKSDKYYICSWGNDKFLSCKLIKPNYGRITYKPAPSGIFSHIDSCLCCDNKINPKKYIEKYSKGDTPQHSCDICGDRIYGSVYFTNHDKTIICSACKYGWEKEAQEIYGKDVNVEAIVVSNKYETGDYFKRDNLQIKKICVRDTREICKEYYYASRKYIDLDAFNSENFVVVRLTK